MAIVYPINMPSGTRGPSNITITGNAIVGIDRSPFSFASQVQVFPGQMWKADVTLAPMTGDDAEAWVAFFLSLNGQQGTFLMGDPLNIGIRGNLGSNTAEADGINAAFQNQLNLKNLPVSTTKCFKAGDWIQIGSTAPWLYKVLQNTDSNSDGKATVTVWPSLRVATIDSDVMITANTKGQFKLASNPMPYSFDTTKYYSMSFSAVEAL